ncbi:MAG: winged helix-turn-helix domain-containing protein [Nanoarchaeota archaeon]|nr:winged helix-turn-helix domain-containing protein [Nanoarchaeota archaeon]
MVQKRDNLDSEIIQFLLRQEYHIRGLAKALNESHSTILRKLDKLVKKDVLDSKKEGKNKIFFIKKNIISKNYILQSEISKLTSLINKYPELMVVLEEISRKVDEKLIVIFGSYAKLKVKKDSDIDVYIETTNRNIKQLVEGIHPKINVKIGLFDLKSNLIKEIIKNHIIVRGFEELYEKEQFFE